MKSIINPVIIEDSDGLILFDAGYPKQGHDFENALAKLGLKIADISKIVLSHHDHDHIGSLCELKQRNPKIKVLASDSEARFISGKEKSLRLTQAEEYNETLTGEDKVFGEQFAQYLKTINTCTVDITINNNDYICKNIKVINTPGHTPGHISLLIEDEKALLTGDAVAIENEELVLPNPQFTLDKMEALRSIEKIKEMKLSKIFCYHGNIFNGSIDEGLSTILRNEKNV